jgi:regulator of protease activity HflC (stomatin/prohibitin superfamily)
MFSFFIIVKQQTVVIIETFGKYTRVARAGLNFKLPWPIQTTSEPLSLKMLEISQNVTVKSVDNAFLEIPIRVQYRIHEEHAQDAYYKLSKPEDQIKSYVLNQVRSTASSMTFDDLFKARDSFEADVAQVLKGKMQAFGYHIENVLVDDPQPSADLRMAFDRVISSQRLREAAENEGEAARVKAVAQANAEGESLKIKAEAFANFRKIIAEGNSQALKTFCDETGLTAHDALGFFTSINEMEAVREAAHNGGKVVFVSGSSAKADTSALMGMVAAINSKSENA